MGEALRHTLDDLARDDLDANARSLWNDVASVARDQDAIDIVGSRSHECSDGVTSDRHVRSRSTSASRVDVYSSSGLG